MALFRVEVSGETQCSLADGEGGQESCLADPPSAGHDHELGPFRGVAGLQRFQFRLAINEHCVSKW